MSERSKLKREISKLKREISKILPKMVKNIIYIVLATLAITIFDMVTIVDIGATIVIVISSINLVILPVNYFIKSSEYHRSRRPSYINSNDLNAIFKELEEQLRQQQRRKQQQQRVATDTKTTNAYRLMKVSKTDEITVIKKAYRTFAKEWHPDKFINDTEENKTISNNNIQRLNNAYDLIKKDKNFN